MDFFVDPKDKTNKIYIRCVKKNLWEAGDNLATLESADVHYGNPERWVCHECNPEFLKKVFTTWKLCFFYHEEPKEDIAFDAEKIKELTGGDPYFQRK